MDSQIVTVFLCILEICGFFYIYPVTQVPLPIHSSSVYTDFFAYVAFSLSLTGCRSALVNVEARSIDARVYTRRCVISRLNELTVDKFKEMVSQNAGALLVLLPTQLNNLSQEDKQVSKKKIEVKSCKL